jgi:glycine cleavage system H protein
VNRGQNRPLLSTAMDVPEDLRYSSDHEWARQEGTAVRVGITDYAQDALGDIVYVGLPAIGTVVEAGASISEVESTKSVSDIYAPLAGTIIEVNQTLSDTPDVVNSDPYGAGWLFVVQPTDPAALDALLDASAYRALVDG